MSAVQRPDDEFIGELCSGCHKPIGREFGGKMSMVGLANGEWLHLRCVADRFACPVTGKPCYHKPNKHTECSKCFSHDPKSGAEVFSMIERAAEDD